MLDVMLGDSGSDINAITKPTFKEVKHAKPDLLVTTLLSRMVMFGAFKTDPVKFIASSKVKLTLPKC